MKTAPRVRLAAFSPKHIAALLVLGALPMLVAVAPSAVAQPPVAQPPVPLITKRPATVFQVSTLPALSLGHYDGQMTVGQLLKHGNFGLGTFDGLDGEGIILDGKAWQVNSEGKVSRVDNKTTTPFAAVTDFVPDQIVRVAQPLEFEALKKRLTELLPTANATYAFQIRGTFSSIKVRSVPRQSKPYPLLSDVVKTQTEWEWKDLSGTLVGFRFPSFLSGVNLADYHFHFLSDDQRHGGHVLDCQIQSGESRIQTLRGFQMYLPSSQDFEQADLSSDQTAALHAAEKAGSR